MARQLQFFTEKLNDFFQHSFYWLFHFRPMWLNSINFYIREKWSPVSIENDAASKPTTRSMASQTEMSLFTRKAAFDFTSIQMLLEKFSELTALNKNLESEIETLLEQNDSQNEQQELLQNKLMMLQALLSSTNLARSFFSFENLLASEEITIINQEHLEQFLINVEQSQILENLSDSIQRITELLDDIQTELPNFAKAYEAQFNAFQQNCITPLSDQISAYNAKHRHSPIPTMQLSIDEGYSTSIEMQTLQLRR